MEKKKIGPGDVVRSHCSRCKDIANHTVIALVGDKIVKVQCNACGGAHAYRPEVPAPREKKEARVAAAPRERGTAKKTKADPSAAEAAEWEEISATLDAGRAVKYVIDVKLRADDVVDHPVFGLGIVRGKPVQNKAEILFQGGKKLLRCG